MSSIVFSEIPGTIEDTAFIKSVFDSIASNSSTKQKQIILNEYKDDQRIRASLYFLFNPFIVTGLSAKKIAKIVKKPPSENLDSFFKAAHYLVKHNTGTDEDIANISAYISSLPDEFASFCSAMFTKSQRLGCDVKTVNKVFGAGFIPQWEVQQSYRFDTVKLDKNEWFSLSQKLNGVRGTYFGGKMISRQGKEFEGLDHIISDISKLDEFKSYVFDGELIRNNVDNLSDNENFRIGTGILNQDGQDKSSIQLVIFDILPMDEFEKGESELSYKDRLVSIMRLKELIAKLSLENIRVVDTFYEGSDLSMVDFYLQKMVDEDKEGLMLNRDSKYYCKRHSGILKVKRFYTVDLRIIGIEEGSGRLSGTLGAFVVDYHGNTLNVGTGLSDLQRSEYFSMRDELIGRVIEVKYKEESFDKNTGQKSLQFPVFVRLREEGKTESYS